ncbi:gliding motility-associated C-terminal domain-containing protein [Flavivirga sp. 57AJ16]|uniref:gliding motility-associated C-terminal domain-containing protein n=1 Tax=Flavivirga sp. 57AJ16 TaxID=3025307 RepID=UPI0023656399|nr:gliding motility-associated C-terminal domain-containing protein [Flavivirga sp. 57AJ16]MDD7885589.1 gliding motility-associated C-terminal domain-containing protein [Flavivirga sp. 57AJ16]
MKRTLLSINVLKNTCYMLLLLCTSLSVFAQCPTIADPNPPPICDASEFTFNDLNAYATDGGNGIVWYNALTGGAPFDPNEWVVEGTYYADDNSGTCGARESIVVDFTVDPTGLNFDRVYCSNENATVQSYIDDVLQSSIPPSGSVEVYYRFDLVNQVNPATVFPNGQTNLSIVFMDNGGCKSQFENTRVGVFASPQNPTPANPQNFCSNTSTTIADLDTGTVATNFRWYDNVDGSGAPIGISLPSTTPLVDGNTYYIQIDDGSCTSNAIPVTVNIDDPVDAGSSGTLQYCEDNIPVADFDLFDELVGFPQTTGNWTGPLPTTNGHLGTVNISTLIAGTHVFTYTISGGGTCPDGISTVAITIYEPLSSGTPSLANPATFCESGLPSNFDLTTLLENHDPNGQWTQGTLSSDPPVTSPIDLTTGAYTAGTYNFTYTQNRLTPCLEESTTVQVVVLADPHAGTAINALICENELAANSPYNLFDALDGSQDHNGGTWTDATNAPVTNSIDVTGFTVAGSPYTFNYTIDNGACSDTESITITVEPAPESGTPVATFPEFCEGTAPAVYDLFDLLDNEDQTGTWYLGVDNTGATATNPTDLSGLTAGTYDFTFDVDAIGSCDDVLVTVQVTINPLPNTGTPTPAIYCENDLGATPTSLNLFDQLTGETGGGTWTDDDTTGALTGSNLDLTALVIGSYNFTYTITDASTCTNSSIVTVTINDAPESGTPIATFPEFCEGDIQTVNLFDLLTDEDQTGTWNDDDTSGALSGNEVAIGSLTSGTYDFTFDVDAIGSCDDANVTVSIIINPLPNTGTPTPTIYCENDLGATPTSLNLFDQLTGETGGGTWTDDDTTGALTGSNLDLTALAIGSYNFTYTITDASTCTNSSIVTVTINDAPESGTPIAPMPEFCVVDITAAQTVDLFDLLTGEDQTGIWNDDDASGVLSVNEVTIDGLAPGTYNFTYDVTSIGSCDDVDVTVSITINDTAAPTASTVQEFCDMATVGDLSVISGTTIQWYEDATGGTPLAGTIGLVDGENYFATDMDAATGCESSTRTEVTVTIHQSPHAGMAINPGISECNNTTINLFDGLDGTQDSGGTWYEGTDNTGTVVASPTAYDVTGFSANNYQFTYYVIASAPCVDDSTTITVTIDEPLNAGTDNTLDVCSTDATTDLFTLLGAADPGGVWSPALASGTGIFDPSVDASGTYTYTHNNACGTSSSQVDVAVTQAPNAGADNSALICMIDGPTDLFTFLGGADTGGTWSPALASGTGVFDPLVDPQGVYRYTVTANAPCATDASADITVTISDSPPPVVNSPNPEFCLVDNPTVANLDATLTATGTITWYEDAALTAPLNATDTLIDGEDYYATQTGSSGCESSANAQVNVTVNDTPTPTLDDPAAEYCINDDPTINDLSLNITEYSASTNNILWYDAAINGSVISESAILNHNVTYYAALVDATTGCESSVRLAITTDLTACGKLIIPDGFSPNGDGTNDTFDIDHLGVLYPNFSIEIFNRYGNIVYKGHNNAPRFDGTSNQSRTIGSGDLPVGVYFYIFYFNDGENKPEQGRLYLSR